MDPGEVYLENGSWQGPAQLSAALDDHDRVCVACDRFRPFGRARAHG